MIDLVPDDVQRSIADLADKAVAAVAGRSGAELSDGEWAALGELGLFGVALPESRGGTGGGTAAEVLVGGVLGARLAPVSLAAPMIAAHLLAERGDDSFAGVRDGTMRTALAVGDGERTHVVDLTGADLVVIIGAEAVAVADTAALIEPSTLDGLDGGAQLAICAGAGTVRAGSPDRGLRARAHLLLAAMAVGVAGAVLDRSVAHARGRHQFGQPIGAFQAVKHRCVDMAVRHEAALASVRFAAVRLDAGHADAASAAAALVAVKAAVDNASSAIQVFGGLGFTAELGLQRYLARAWLLDRLLGPRAAIEDALIEAALASCGGE